MVSLLKNVVTIKHFIILLIVTALAAGIVAYINYNGSNVAWCALNGNDCRVSRLKALERNYIDAQPKVADEGK